MESLEAELERARELSVDDLADAVESIGFECTRCGACCRAVEPEETGDDPEPHTATLFPGEARELREAAGERFDDTYDWRDVARPMPYGIAEGEDGPEGETFEWAIQTDACGDCVFYAERAGSGTAPRADDGAGDDGADDDGADDAGANDDGADDDGADDDGVNDDSADVTGVCTVHESRPLICRTYPFSVVLANDESEVSSNSPDGVLGATSQPMGEAVDEAGVVRAHECEGLGRDIDRESAEELASALKTRAIRELEEAIELRDRYTPRPDADGVVVHDSEGAKRPDGSGLNGR